ncbi:DEAD/DEAH box helicase [Dethiothermospora halolimnae]|uniref:DEAD/DEAH box helicase n=1 Tax=Dethiothermospora halolimnae TaxID=3114390 RepID=UPI003CCB9C56
MPKNFINLGISKNLDSVLKDNYITEPTAVQNKAIPEILKGRDVITQAQTGTGKTLAFMLPIIEKINTNRSQIQSLIVTPTRELAIQITSEAEKFTDTKGINILSVYGGKDVNKQIKKLKKDIHMVIGTPGRLLDHIRRGTVDFKSVKNLVLDEADQMLTMGFLQDVEKIIKQTPRSRQTMFFSATIPKKVHSLANKYMKNPIKIDIKGNNITLDKIEQLVIETTNRNKEADLFKAIEKYRPFLAIIFCRTKNRVKDINGALKRRGYDSEELHGDLSQRKRERIMKIFRKAKVQFLVATDVASRGLDVDNITHVFNYDIPEEPESYIHRIGRTARAGEEGVSITFATSRDRDSLSLIERSIKMDMKKIKL